MQFLTEPFLHQNTFTVLINSCCAARETKDRNRGRLTVPEWDQRWIFLHLQPNKNVMTSKFKLELNLLIGELVCSNICWVELFKFEDLHIFSVLHSSKCDGLTPQASRTCFCFLALVWHLWNICLTASENNCVIICNLRLIFTIVIVFASCPCKCQTTDSYCICGVRCQDPTGECDPDLWTFSTMNTHTCEFSFFQIQSSFIWPENKGITKILQQIYSKNFWSSLLFKSGQMRSAQKTLIGTSLHALRCWKTGRDETEALVICG